MDTTPNVAMHTLENNFTLITIKQHVNGQNVELMLSPPQFSGLLFIMKSIETKLANDVVKNNNNAVTDFEDFSRETLNIDCCSTGVPAKQQVSAVEEVPPPCKKARHEKPMKSVREELLEIYTELICDKIHEVIQQKCLGCILFSVKRTDHNVCKIMARKQRVEYVFQDLWNMLDENVLREVLTQRRWNQSLPYNEKKMYISKEQLATSSTWLKRLKNAIEKRF